jgi:hypothetical protein
MLPRSPFMDHCARLMAVKAVPTSCQWLCSDGCRCDLILLPRYDMASRTSRREQLDRAGGQWGNWANRNSDQWYFSLTLRQMSLSTSPRSLRKSEAQSLPRCPATKTLLAASERYQRLRISLSISFRTGGTPPTIPTQADGNLRLCDSLRSSWRRTGAYQAASGMTSPVCLRAGQPSPHL